MIAKDRIFKKGDVIVSGFGNIRILVGETGDGKAGDGAKGVFYDALTMYCESDAPAGTDMRYARHATEKEKKMFFGTLKANGLVYDAKTYTIKAGENYKGIETENVLARRNSKGPQPFKVVKKRVRPTLCQIRLLEEKVKLLDEIINTHCKEKAELKDHLDEVKGCNEKMAKELKNTTEQYRLAIIREQTLSERLKELEYQAKLDAKERETASITIARLEEDNRRLGDKNTTLEQSNKLLKDKLERKTEACNSLADQLEDKNADLASLMNRGFFARLFNLK